MLLYLKSDSVLTLLTCLKRNVQMVLQMFIISFIAFQIIKFIKPIPPNDQQERKQLI